MILQTGGSAVGEISTRSSPRFARHFNGFVRLHDAELTAFFIDDPDFTRPDALVYSSAIGRLPEVAFCDISP